MDSHNNIPKINGSQNEVRAAAKDRVTEFSDKAKEKSSSVGDWINLQ